MEQEMTGRSLATDKQAEVGTSGFFRSELGTYEHDVDHPTTLCVQTSTSQLDVRGEVQQKRPEVSVIVVESAYHGST